MQKKESLMFLAAIFLIVVIVATVNVFAAERVMCDDCYSVCTEGGCNAHDFWYCQDCYIFYCLSGFPTHCTKPPN